MGHGARSSSRLHLYYVLRKPSLTLVSRRLAQCNLLEHVHGISTWQELEHLVSYFDHPHMHSIIDLGLS